MRLFSLGSLHEHAELCFLVHQSQFVVQRLMFSFVRSLQRVALTQRTGAQSQFFSDAKPIVEEAAKKQTPFDRMFSSKMDSFSSVPLC